MATLSKRNPYAKKAIVYIAHNKVNDKRYIGVTCHRLNYRKSQHFSDAKRSQKTIFYKAIRKYGRDNFVFNVIWECDSYREALFIEIGMIKLFHPEYNMTSGGEGVRGFKKTPEMIERQRERQKGKNGLIGYKQTPEHSAKIAAAMKGIDTMPEEKREQRRLMALAESMKKRRPVICITDSKKFSGAREADRYYGFPEGSVALVCHRPNGSIHKMKFEWDKNEFQR